MLWSMVSKATER